MKDRLIDRDDTTSFHKKLIYILVFTFITPIALFTSLFSLVTLADNNGLSNSTTNSANNANPQVKAVHIYAALPYEEGEISAEIVAGDSRPEIIRQYLSRYNSPMEPYADHIVEMSDKYGLDYRLTTAIAMKESGLGRLQPHENCNNAWGWGIHSAGTLCFDSWEEGIETVSRGIKNKYIDLGYETPELMMQKYTPLSQGTWAVGVIYYMSQLQ